MLPFFGTIRIFESLPSFKAEQKILGQESRSQMRTGQNMTWGGRGGQDPQTLMDGPEMQPEPQKGHLGTSPLPHFLLHRLFWSSTAGPWNCSMTAQLEVRTQRLGRRLLRGSREGSESPPIPAHPGTSPSSFTAAGPKLTGKSGAPQT